MERFILAIDQGTTSTRAILFDHETAVRGTAQKELPQIFPQQGWVEHDPEEIWSATMEVCQQVLKENNTPAENIASIGITNQRETVVLWNRETGKALHNALVWQDRRTAEHCESLRKSGNEALVTKKTGLLLDPYFSATKIAWLLDHVEGARDAANAGQLCIGTIECFLLWRLTGGKVHATDISNASRTLLFNIHQQEWDQDLLELFGNIPRSILPEVRDTADDFGVTESSLFGAPIPIGGMIGDQQAATFGQCCFEPGDLKSTYGTGCFVLINTGPQAVPSTNRMLTTIAWKRNGQVTYAMEGSAFSAGSTMQWLRDGLKLFEHASESADLAAQSNPAHRVHLVPAFTGLGAPWWNPHARGAILGITRDTGVADIVRAGLEAVCFQTRDLLDAMAADGAGRPNALRVDGGMVGNDWAMQFLANILGVAVERPQVTETTALGAACMAGLQCGFWNSESDLANHWKLDTRFEPQFQQEDANSLHEEWSRAVQRVL
ncbi:MAG: glycerol kinase GlpK [Planctomycetota bacterium]|jgi:glycerol kinase|nr:glycerol kinase GlpK [Planctomycetota bacterium]MDP6941412.1 glycerol kinase GlpK [Planctomycetota bacterium]